MMTFEEFKEKFGKPFYNGEISVSWRIGGISGGNCWGVGGHYSITADREPEFTELDNILNEICPTIPFLKYKILCSECVNTKESTEREYYGNCTEYCKKYVKIEDLYACLVRMELL